MQYYNECYAYVCAALLWGWLAGLLELYSTSCLACVVCVLWYYLVAATCGLLFTEYCCGGFEGLLHKAYAVL
jgi:hypothetical protein